MIGIFGGTFDPIHKGHLQPVEQAARQLAMQQVHVLPCHIPPHRQTPAVNAAHRLRMVQLACQQYPQFIADDRELNRTTPSYSFDTLTEFRQQYPQQPLGFIMGMDAFNHFDSWHRWQDIVGLSHLIVCQRPGYKMQLNSNLDALVTQHGNQDVDALHRRPSGVIYFAKVALIDISATEIRQQLYLGQSANHMLYDNVAEYIRQQGLYSHGV
ncbi:nicotinate-nucleotide adenylyltransferase [Neptunicella sp.]|uniref:nicotinate-nucleotide adenylyltransferase n=1 Tax=Neptunicella sp. TaxID=2125986 RepID=UPI003F68CEF0